MANEIGDVIVRIRADIGDLNTKMDRAASATQRAAGKMESSFAGLRSQLSALLPALSAAAFVSFARNAIEAAGRIQDLSERIGFAASSLSALEPMLNASGSSLEEFSAAIAILNNQLGEAAKGNQESIKSFDQLGLSVTKLLQLNEEQRFIAVANALGSIGDQAQRTEAGRNLLGRGFAALNPILAEANGNFGELIDKQKDLSITLSDNSVDRIDKFGDALSKAGTEARNAFLETFAVLLRIGDWISSHADTNLSFWSPGSLMVSAIKQAEQNDKSAYLAKAKAGGFVTEPTILKAHSASGSNAGLLQSTPAQEYIKKLQQQQKQLSLPQPERAAQQAEDELRNIAAKDKTIKITQQQIELARKLAAANYEAQNPDPIQKYVESLQQEKDAMALGDKELFIRKALMQEQEEMLQRLPAGTKAVNALTEEQTALVRENAAAFYDMKEAQEQIRHISNELADSLADLAVNFKSLGDTAVSAIQSIAKEIIRSQFTKPLSDSIMGGIGGLFGSGGFSQAIDNAGAFLGLNASYGPPMPAGFAEGGRPPVGVPSIVGERGPEIFVPDSAGTIYPNGTGPEGGVSVTHVWNISPGLQGAIRSELLGAMPLIEQRTTTATMQAIQRGGAEARIVGKRN